MQNVREEFQTFARRFGFLNKHCCSTCGCNVSLVQSHILDEVSRRSKPSMQQVADALGMDITTFSRQVQTLVKMQLLTKNPDTQDRRVYLLQLTEQGEKVAAEIDRQVQEQLAEVFAGMSEFEQDMVVRSLRLLNKAMANSTSCCK